MTTNNFYIYIYIYIFDYSNTFGYKNGLNHNVATLLIRSQQTNSLATSIKKRDKISFGRFSFFFSYG